MSAEVWVRERFAVGRRAERRVWTGVRRVGAAWEVWVSKVGQREWESLGLGMCELVGRGGEEGGLTCCLRRGIPGL